MGCFFLIFLTRGTSLAAGVRGNLNVDYGMFQSETSEGLQTGSSRSESLSLNFGTRPVTSLLNYRFSFQASETATEFGGRGQRSLFLQPVLDVGLSGSRYSLALGYRISDNKSWSDGSESEFFSDNTFARFGWFPGGFLPLNLNYNVSRSWNPEGTVDTVTKSLTAGTTLSLGALSLNYSYYTRETADNVAGTKSEFSTHNIAGGYARGLEFEIIKDHLVLRPAVGVTFSIIPGGANVQIANPLTPAIGLAGVNPVPGSGTLANTPVLIDGSTSTGVEIGSGPDGLFQNIGFQLPASSEVAKIFISLNPGFNPSLADSYKFDIYSSVDGNSWVNISSLSVAFNTIDNRFEINVRATAAFFKAVVVANSNQTAQATEISAEGPPVPVPRDLTTVTTNVSMNGEFRISEKDEWDYSSSLSISRTEPTGTESLSSDTGLTLRVATANNNVVSLLYRNTVTRTEAPAIDQQTVINRYAFSLPVTLLPFVVRTSASYQNTVTESSEAGFLEPVNDSYALSFAADPIPTLSHTLSFSRSEDSLGGEPLTTGDSVSLSNYLRLYRGLDSSIALSTTETIDHQTNAESRSRTFDLGVNAILTERLTGRGSYQFYATEGADYTQGIGLSLSYKLSQLFRLSGSLNSSESGDSSSLSQSYNLAWGFSQRLSTRFTYARSSSESAGGTFENSAFRSEVSWQVNKSISLSLNYNQSESDTDSAKRIFLSMNATI